MPDWPRDLTKKQLLIEHILRLLGMLEKDDRQDDLLEDFDPEDFDQIHLSRLRDVEGRVEGPSVEGASVEGASFEEALEATESSKPAPVRPMSFQSGYASRGRAGDRGLSWSGGRLTWVGIRV